MMDFLFFVKTFCLTIVLVVLMQIQVGQSSIESHALGWVQHSAVVSPLNQTAHGAAQLIRDLTGYISQSLKKKESKDKKEETRSSFRWLYGFKKEQAQKDQ